MDLPNGGPVPDSNNASVVRVWSVSSLEGVLLTFLESLGLPERQEKASKSILRNSLWDWYRSNPSVREVEGDYGKLEYISLGSGVSTDSPKKKK